MLGRSERERSEWWGGPRNKNEAVQVGAVRVGAVLEVGWGRSGVGRPKKKWGGEERAGVKLSGRGGRREKGL